MPRCDRCSCEAHHLHLSFPDVPAKRQPLDPLSRSATGIVAHPRCNECSSALLRSAAAPAQHHLVAIVRSQLFDPHSEVSVAAGTATTACWSLSTSGSGTSSPHRNLGRAAPRPTPLGVPPSVRRTTARRSS